MKAKQFQILICLFLTSFVTMSCRQNSSLKHDTPLTPNHTPVNKKVEIIKASPLNVSNKQNSPSVPDISDTTSDLEPTHWEARIRRWATNTRNELDNGTRECNALTTLQCKWSISEYENLAIDWVRLPIFERETQRQNDQVLQINKAKKLVFGKVTLGTDFLSILDEIDTKDKEALPEVIENIIDNEPYPSLSDVEKVDQWASESLENFEPKEEGVFKFLSPIFHWSNDTVVRNAQSFLREWVQLTPNQRDRERSIARGAGRNIREPLDPSLYEEDENLRALWWLIEARDMLSRSQRELEYQKDLKTRHQKSYQNWLGWLETEKLEAERSEAEAQRRELEETIHQWRSLSFEQRESLRENNEDITNQINIAAIPLNLRTQIETIEEDDLQARNETIRREREQAREEQIQEAQDLREIQQQITNWHQLSFEQRENQRRSNQGLTDQINLSSLPDNLRTSAEEIENSDALTRNQLARAELDRRKNMSYEDRSELDQKLEDLFDVLRLPDELQREIRQLHESDIETRSNRRRASQWAAARSKQERLESARQTIQDQSIVGYRRAKVKLWPIRCYNTYHPVYPYTDDTKPIHLNLSSSDGLRLEIHSNTSKEDEFVLLSGEVTRAKLQISAPYDLYNVGNYIEYESKGETQIYRLNRLIDIQGNQTVYHIKVHPRGEAPIRITWEETQKGRVIKVDRNFRGDFRIEITDRRSSDRSEWSLINDLPIEWYMRSVVGSEVPSSYTINAHSAQAVASRSYFLNKALEDRDVQARGWDIDPTQCNQVYRGIEQEREKADMAISETAGLVLTYNDRLAKTQYYACGRRSTKDGSNDNGNPIEKPRNIPSNITCSKYSETIIDVHGYGMPQFVVNELTRTGWENNNDNAPTDGARVPEDIHKPWLWRDVLHYFYRGEHPQVEIQDFRNL